MRSFRRPKGTVIRTVPDWNSANLGSATIIGPEIQPGFYELGIFNNATDGSYLVLWDAQASATVTQPNDPATLISGFKFYNNPNPPIVGFSNGANPTVGQPFGAGFYNGDPTIIPQNSDYGPTFFGIVQYSWGHDFPLAYIPPGYIFSFTSDYFAGNSNFARASFFWEVTPWT